jgi:uncharacterized membrane protein
MGYSYEREIVLKYFMQVLENSATVAIVAAMIFALAFFAQQTLFGVVSPQPLFGTTRLRNWFAAGSIAGILAGLVLAVFRYTTSLINREFWSIAELSAAIFCGIILIILLWLPSKSRRSRIRPVLGAVSGAVFLGATLFYSMPTIFLYPTEFVLAGQSIFSTDFLSKLLGYLAGIVVLILIFLAVGHAGKSIGGKKLAWLVTFQIALCLVQYAATILQFLVARRLLPHSDFLFKFIIATVNHSDFFIYISLAFAVALLLFAWKRSRALRASYPNPAEQRKDVSVGIRYRRWCRVGFVCFVLVVLCLTVIKTQDAKGVTLSPAEAMTIRDGVITIPAEQVGDGHLHRFAYQTKAQVEVRFIIVKKSEAAFGVGLDACDICGATGYYERNDDIVCKLCDVVMNRQTIGFKGGCNPVPLLYEMKEGNIVIQTEDLEQEKHRFR